MGTANDSVYRSIDNGLTWQRLSVPWTTQLVCVVKVDTDLYALTSGSGLYRGSLSGTNWKQASNLLPSGDLRSVASDGYALYLGLTSGRIFRSADKGLSWMLVSQGIPNSTVAAIAVLGADVIAATELGGVFRSTNGGASWTASNAGLSGVGATMLATYNSAVFASTARNGLFKSIDSGRSWVSANAGLDSAEVVGISGTATTLLAATRANGVFRSTDVGASWTPVNSGLATMDLFAIAVTGDNVFVLGADGHIYSANVTALSWTKVNTDFTTGSYHSTRALLLTGYGLVAGTQGGGVFVTTDGVNWTARNNGITRLNVLALAQVDNTTFADFYKSSDQGANWKWSPPSIQWDDTTLAPFIADSTVHGFALRGSTLFAAVASFDKGRGVYRTSNLGDTWEQVLSNFTGIAVSVHDDVTLAAGDGIWRSRDGGTTWSDASLGLRTHNFGYVTAIAWVGTTAFAGAILDGVYSSTNTGDSWLPSPGGVPDAVLTLLSYNGNLLAGTSNGVFLSTDTGRSWDPVNTGLEQRVYCLTISGSYLYAGTRQGVWRRPISEIIPNASVASRSDAQYFTVLPNPVTDVALMRFGDVPGSGSVRIYNAVGNEVARFELTDERELRFDARALPPGWYSLVWTDGTRAITRSIVKLAR